MFASTYATNNTAIILMNHFDSPTFVFCHLLIQVRAEELHIEMDSIEKGIVELISQRGIRMLVMGAAADKHYSK